MKGYFLFLLCALVIAQDTVPIVSTRFDTTTAVTAGSDVNADNAYLYSNVHGLNEKNDTKSSPLPSDPVTAAQLKAKNAIPSYGARNDVLEAIGVHYPISHEQHYNSLLKQHMISDGNNQFSRIHAEIQKNNEKPLVYDEQHVTPIISPKNQLADLLNSMNQFEQDMISNDNVKTGITKSTEDLGATTKESPVLSTPAKYTLPTIDLTSERKALKEHQLNTEVQLHRLLHAMDMISESIYDPLQDQYAQGTNEMLNAYLNDPFLNHNSPLYKHIAADHAFFFSPYRGERVAETLYQQATAQQEALKQQQQQQPQAKAEPQKTEEKDKAALRQKTVEQSQVRH